MIKKAAPQRKYEHGHCEQEAERMKHEKKRQDG
jgi:hypothetical protein